MQGLLIALLMMGGGTTDRHIVFSDPVQKFQVHFPAIEQWRVESDTGLTKFTPLTLEDAEAYLEWCKVCNVCEKYMGEWHNGIRMSGLIPAHEHRTPTFEGFINYMKGKRTK